MRSLVEDLGRTAAPHLLGSNEELRRSIKEFHAELLRVALGASTSAPDGEQLAQLRRYALWLEDAARSPHVPEREARRANRLASHLLEFCGVAQLEHWEEPCSIFRGPWHDLLRASLLASIADSEARAAVVARSLQRLMGAGSPRSSAERVQGACIRALCFLLARQQVDAVFAFREAEANLASAEKELDGGYGENLADLDRAVTLGACASQAASGLLLGEGGLLDSAIASAQRLEEVTLREKDARHWALAARLREVLVGMRDASMHLILAGHDIPDSFRRTLVREGVLELWRHQREAIGQGLLQPDRHFIASVPTGAGKSLLAELAILAALKKEGAWAVYITPSRALVNQVSSDLRRRLGPSGIEVRTVVAGAEQGALLVNELSLLESPKGVTVSTPEKLDAYFRNAPELFANCALAVIDEAHKVGEAGRGALLESLISRFLAREGQMKVVMLSGVMSNAAELSGWLGEERTGLVTSTQRATRQTRAVAVRTEITPEDGKPSKSHGVVRRVKFRGGLVLVSEDEDLTPPLTVHLDDVFSGFYYEQQQRTRWKEGRCGRSPTSSTDHALELARRFVSLPGSTLVFVNLTSSAEKGAREFAWTPDDQWSEQRRKLAEYVAAELGEDHELARACARGVAFHHAQLPTGVQRAIELGLAQGWLKVVFATPTLKEGLNTPATNVIVAGDKFFDQRADEQVSIKEADFENMAGRAGRPFQDTEGRIVLVPNSLATATATASGRQYLLTGSEALRAISQLEGLAQAIDHRGGGGILALDPDQQRLLLTLEAAGLSDDVGTSRFFSESLWALQQHDDERVERVAQRSSQCFSITRQQVGPERLALASKIGLSLSSAEAIHTGLEAGLDRFLASSESTAASAEAWLRRALEVLLGIALKLPEISSGMPPGDVEEHLAPIAKWVSGARYPEVLAAALASGGITRRKGSLKDPSVGAVVKYCSAISTWLSWAFGACSVVLESIAAERNAVLATQASHIPLLVRYGVPKLSAAYLALLGVHDREAAQVLGDIFEEAHSEVNLVALRTWLETVDDQLEGLFPGADVRIELLRRSVMGTRPRIPYLFLRLEGADGSRGDILRLAYRDERYVEVRRVYDDAPCGFLDADAVERFSERVGLEAVVGVIASVGRKGRGVAGLLRRE